MKKIELDYDYLFKRTSFRNLLTPSLDSSLRLIHEVFRIRHIDKTFDDYNRQFRLYPSPGAISGIELLFVNQLDNSIYLYDALSSSLTLRYRGDLSIVYKKLRIMLGEEKSNTSPNIIAMYLNEDYYKQRYGDIYLDLMNREIGAVLSYLYIIAEKLGLQGCALGRPIKDLNFFAPSGYVSYGGFCFGKAQ